MDADGLVLYAPMCFNLFLGECINTVTISHISHLGPVYINPTKAEATIVKNK